MRRYATKKGIRIVEHMLGVNKVTEEADAARHRPCPRVPRVSPYREPFMVEFPPGETMHSGIVARVAAAIRRALLG
jgi:hypothetical protein